MTSTPPSLAERFASALDRVVREVGNRVRRWNDPNRPGTIPEAVCLRIQSWLFRRKRLVTELIARFQAGRLRRPLPYRPRPRPPGAPPPAQGQPPGAPLPRGRRWLYRLVPEVGPAACWLDQLLTEAALPELARASPQLGRHLRPVLRAIGREVPAWLDGPPRPPRPRPPRPPPQPPPQAGPAEADRSPQAGPAEADRSPLLPLDRRYGSPGQWRRRERALDEVAAAKAAAPPAQAPPPPRAARRWVRVDFSR